MSSSDEDLEAQLKTAKKKKKPKKKAVRSDSESDGSPRRQASPKPAEHHDPQGSPSAREPSPSAAAAPADDDVEDLEEFYAQLKKTKKKKRTAQRDAEEAGGKAVRVEIDIEALNKTDRDYTYQEMLALVYEAIKGRGGRVREEPFRLRPPQVVRDGTKKVVWTNFPDICKTLCRQEEHLFAFSLAELGTTGSLDGKHCFVMKGRFTDRHLEDLLRKYVTAYVACQMCRSLATTLVKDPHSRLTTLNCNQCNATRTVQSITSGFSAQIGRRRRR